MPVDPRLVAARAAEMQMELKRKIRILKKKIKTTNRLAALPRVRHVAISPSYTNPVTLNKIPSGIIVYAVTDPRTKRVNYFDKKTFWKLVSYHAPRVASNYNLMMARKNVLFPNPATRVPIQGKNVERVVARPKPTRSAAARKIQSAYRKKVAARKSH
jgi:hypothetical protein